MSAARYIRMIDATFAYFGSLGNWHQDPSGVDAVKQVRDRMAADLIALKAATTRSELTELCRQWRALRIVPSGVAEYPPDMFIESVCEVVELS